MERSAKAQWKGDLRSGGGTISAASGVLSNTPYSFKDRFEQGTGTNPEELLAAAHALGGAGAHLPRDRRLQVLRAATAGPALARVDDGALP